MSPPVHSMMTKGRRRSNGRQTNVTGGLFPVLDADITLTPAGEQTTRLALAGVYRPPLGRLGEGSTG